MMHPQGHIICSTHSLQHCRKWWFPVAQANPLESFLDLSFSLATAYLIPDVRSSIDFALQIYPNLTASHVHCYQPGWIHHHLYLNC